MIAELVNARDVLDDVIDAACDGNDGGTPMM
ncbi:hypothetical protein BCF44_105308 [Kutzneria buriramensis]|uniref:Uncharacterized protein n=1 Tax=Kutzneria buriramensis TaxID=1045776 RepID=A0A3E0HPX0_9PSEU|nr:hypothetical protein BCF44_105308 [Kutzneria buriramensis]